MKSRNHPLEHAVRDARAEYLDCCRRLQNVLKNAMNAELLLESLEEYGSEETLRELRQNPLKFEIARTSPLLLPKSLSTLEQILADCEQAQWELDGALSRREDRGEGTTTERRQVFAFGGREAEVDFNSGTLSYRDGSHEIVPLEFKSPDNQRRGARRR